MSVLLFFLLTISALAIITTPLLKKEKYAWWTGGTILVGSVVISSIGTYRTCQDGWLSSSIGKQGACSWHGGVVTRLTDFGEIVLVVSLVIIIGAIIHVWHKERKNSKLIK